MAQNVYTMKHQAGCAADIMSNCANVDIGVWSANLIDRTVVVAVYGTGDGAPPCSHRTGRSGSRALRRRADIPTLSEYIQTTYSDLA